jgi:hypothetical protein
VCVPGSTSEILGKIKGRKSAVHVQATRLYASYFLSCAGPRCSNALITSMAMHEHGIALPFTSPNFSLCTQSRAARRYKSSRHYRRKLDVSVIARSKLFAQFRIDFAYCGLLRKILRETRGEIIQASDTSVSRVQ